MYLPPPRSHFSLSLKTYSSFGLIFYVSDVQEDNFMALFLAHGKLVYTFNVAEQRVKIKSDDKYNDGAWHNVSLSPTVLNVCLGKCVFVYVSTLCPVTTPLSSPAEGYFYPWWECGSINNWWAHSAGGQRSGKRRLLAYQQSPLCWRSSSWESPEEYSGMGKCWVWTLRTYTTGITWITWILYQCM